ncbi:hypothetical protein Ae201684_003451 [Aphanomyces euteiches]|uniref:Uncharacterized protein n=1 Tax=Aphanomyces euteiches TaxID=100861 RepID=A0A6G0XMB4_9STRA|nr:hypothetical protein Ae201684_003451 [Aphanomyces euteiches]
MKTDISKSAICPIADSDSVWNCKTISKSKSTLPRDVATRQRTSTILILGRDGDEECDTQKFGSFGG